MEAKIVLLPGDGVGPEVVNEGRKVLEAVAISYDHRFDFEEQPIGGVAIDGAGDPLPSSTLEACRSAAAVLLGAVGGPKWDDPQAKVRPEQGLLGLRKGLQLYANLRPVRLIPELVDASPLRPELVQEVDILIVRELTGGLYFGEPRLLERIDGRRRAVDTLEYTDDEIRRVVRLAFQLAEQRRGILTSVDKANVLESSRLWRQVAQEEADSFPRVRLEHQLVDAAAMRLIANPRQFDVLVTENMFGDILSDEASVLVGSLGMLPSASIGDGALGVYEPIHGSAPDIAGRGIANPMGAILSVAMLLRHSLKLEVEAAAVEQAVQQAIADGARTADLTTNESKTTAEMGEAIIECLKQGTRHD
ncbi:MAG: 3-isopropylmalate dehydrogenase [Anaerolineae bacterium]|nr:MAG: 3-isopropylmalate dehydrogenase [Anaerolineae bacterium]